MKKVIIIAAVLLLVLGGGAYYELVYHPVQYAKSVVKTLDDIQRNQGPLVTELNRQNLDENAKNFLMVEFQKKLFGEMRKQIADLRPPLFGEMWQFHKDFLWLIDKMLASINLVESQINIFSKGLDCKNSTESYNAPRPANARMSDALRFFEGFTQNIKMVCGAFVQDAGTISSAETPSFVELKAKWEAVLPAIDVLRNFYASQNQDSPGEFNVSNINLGPREKEALPKLGNFERVLDDFLRNNKIDPARYLSPQNSSDPEFKTVSDKVDTKLNEMKEKYGK